MRGDTPVYFGGLAVKGRYFNFRRCFRVGDGHLKLQIELVLDVLVDEPTCAFPQRACFVLGGDLEPIVVFSLVLVYRRNESG